MKVNPTPYTNYPYFPVFKPSVTFSLSPSLLRRFFLLTVGTFLLWILAGGAAFAQGNRASIDSAVQARKRIADSARTARLDALKTLRAAQTARIDSIKTVRAYRTSKKYVDSVTRSRTAALNALKAQRQAVNDSARAARAAVTDSIKAVRGAAIAELRAEQKSRTDSLQAIRAYRASKRYADSVSVVRKAFSDSMQLARKAFADSARASRTALAEANKAARKATADSLTAIRKIYTDSVVAVRKIRSDSLLAKKAEREKLNTEKAKAKEKKMDLALKIKIGKKREKWSNESMLKKAWSPPRKQMQNLFTHYNYFFNANRKMEEARGNMIRAHRDKYESLLPLFPFDPDKDSTLLLADMDSIIQKASVGIQIHDPRTEWADDMYLLLGQAYYYKGSYENAEAAFRYAVSLRDLAKKYNKKKDPVPRSKRQIPSITEAPKTGLAGKLERESAHNDALLWLARTYTQMGKFGESESILDLVRNDPAFPPTLTGDHALEEAYLAMRSGNNNAAVNPLLLVVADQEQTKYQRQRAAYLAGQLLYRQGKYQQSADMYAKVVDFKPQIEMEFQARKAAAYAVIASGKAATGETIASMKKMLKDGKYQPYYEQIYFVLGQLAAQSGDRMLARKYLQQSIDAPKSTKSQKALSYATLGDGFYEDGLYQQAQSSYDSAVFYAGRKAKMEAPFDVAARRATALTGVVRPLGRISVQDSLMRLSLLSEKEQRNVVRKYLKTLSDRRSDSLFRASGGGDVMAAPVANAGGNSGGAPGVGDWYFTSTTTLQQGYNDFKRKWGSRPSTDNWRRSATVAAQGLGQTAPGSTGYAGNVEEGPAGSGDDLPSEAELLAAIPNTAAAKDSSKMLTVRSYMDLSTAYVKDLEDYPRAVKMLDSLDNKYPGHTLQAEAMYLGYLLFLRQNQVERAQSYAQLLLEKYPQSEWADLVRPSDGAAGPLLASNVEAASYYDQTYSMVQQRDYKEAIRRSRDGQRRWTQPKYADRFRLLEIMSLAGTEDWKQADSLIGKFMTTNRNDSLRGWGETVKQYIQKSKAASDSIRRVKDSVTAVATAAAAAAKLPAGGARVDSAGGSTNAAAGNTVAANTTNPAGGNTPPDLNSPNNATNPTTPPANTAGTPPPQEPLVPPVTNTPPVDNSLPAGNAPPVDNTPPVENAPPPASEPPAGPVPPAFVKADGEMHYFVFVFPKMESRTMGLKAALTDFNTLKFGGQSLESSVQFFEGLNRGVVVVKGFINAAAAKTYSRAVAATPKITKEYKAGEAPQFIISETNFRKLMADKSIAPYLNFYRKNY